MHEPQIASMQEIETHWSFRDVINAHEIMDWKDQRLRAENAQRDAELEAARMRRRR